MAACKQVLLLDGAALGRPGAVAVLGRVHLQHPQTFWLPRLRPCFGGPFPGQNGHDSGAQGPASARRHCIRQAQSAQRPELCPSRSPCWDPVALQVGRFSFLFLNEAFSNNCRSDLFGVQEDIFKETCSGWPTDV
jgi:hypothetical protein